MKNILSIIVLVSSSIFANTGYISGIVISENSDTLSGANISIERTEFGTASNREGNFRLENLKPGKYVINVNYISYKQTSKTIYISQFSTDNNIDENELLEKMGLEISIEEEETFKGPFHENIEFILIPDPLGIEEITVAAAKLKQ